MSETHTIVNGNKEDSPGGKETSDSRRGSKGPQSPIKAIFSRAQSLTKRSQNANGSAQNENNVSSTNNMSPPMVSTDGETALKNGLFQRYRDKAANEALPQHNGDQGGGVDIKIQQLQQSPIRQLLPVTDTDEGRLQHMLVQDNDRTISVRIEGKDIHTYIHACTSGCLIFIY